MKKYLTLKALILATLITTKFALAFPTEELLNNEKNIFWAQKQSGESDWIDFHSNIYIENTDVEFYEIIIIPYPFLDSKIDCFDLSLTTDPEKSYLLFPKSEKREIFETVMCRVDIQEIPNAHLVIGCLLKQDPFLASKVNPYRLPFPKNIDDVEIKDYLLLLKKNGISLEGAMRRLKRKTPDAYPVIEWLLEQEPSLISHVKIYPRPLPIDAATKKHLLYLKSKGVDFDDMDLLCAQQKYMYSSVEWFLENDPSLALKISDSYLPLPIDEETKNHLLSLKSKGVSLESVMDMAFIRDSYSSIEWLLENDSSLLEQARSFWRKDSWLIPTDEETKSYFLCLKNKGIINWVDIVHRIFNLIACGQISYSPVLYSSIEWLLEQDPSLAPTQPRYYGRFFPTDEESQSFFLFLKNKGMIDLEYLMHLVISLSFPYQYSSIEWLLEQDPSLIGCIGIFSFPLPVDETSQNFLDNLIHRGLYLGSVDVPFLQARIESCTSVTEQRAALQWFRSRGIKIDYLILEDLQEFLEELQD